MTERTIKELNRYEVHTQLIDTVITLTDWHAERTPNWFSIYEHGRYHINVKVICKDKNRGIDITRNYELNNKNAALQEFITLKEIFYPEFSF